MNRAAIVVLAFLVTVGWHTAGAGSGATLELKEPRGIDVDSQDRIVVAYAGSHVVAVYSPDGQLVRLLGRLDEPGADEAHFDGPYGITVDVGDSIYVADTGNDRICVFDSAGKCVKTIGDADGPGKLSGPRGCELDEQRNVLVADTGNNRIVAFAPDGTYLPEHSIEGEAAKELKEPSNLLLQSFFRGRIQQLIVANAGVGRLDQYEWQVEDKEVEGETQQVGEWVWVKEHWASPDVKDVVSSAESDICAACPGWSCVRRWDVYMRYRWDTVHSTAEKSLYGLEGRGVGKLGVKPYGIAIGSDQRVLVTWPDENRVIKYTEAMVDPWRPEITRLRRTSTVIKYDSLVPVASAVQYSLDGESWRTVAGSPRPTTKHAVRLTGLEPGTQYRFRVQYGCSLIPKTPFWGREWRFATAAPKGMVRYLDMPILVVLYANIYEPANVPEGVEPPTAMTDEGVETVKVHLGQGACGYYFASRWLLNIHYDWVIVNEPQIVFPDPDALKELSPDDRATFDKLMEFERTDENRAEIVAFLKDKLGDALSDRELEWLTAPNRWKQGPNWVWETEEQFDALARAQHGKSVTDYAGCISLGCLWHWEEGEAPNDLAPGRIQAAVYTDPDNPPEKAGYWRQAGSGGLTPYWWGGKLGKHIGRCAFNTGGGTVGLFFHEMGHKMDGQFLFSGYQDYPFNHFASTWFRGRYDNGLSGNGYLLRVYPTEYYFASILGEVKLARDADGDGLADEDPNLLCDEKRFGSSPRRRDTDHDGLSDHDEMLATYGVQEIKLDRERMIERLIPPRPDLPDSDGDGIIDGRDPLPLYPVPSTIAKRTPVLDGQIEPGEWTVYRTFADGELVGTFYMAWDDEAVYFALAADRWAEIAVKFDWLQDGFIWSRDNLFLNVVPDTTDPMAEPPACRVEMRVWDVSYRGVDLRDSGKNERLYDPTHIRTATGAQGGVKVLEVALPRNLRVSLDPRPGMTFDFGCYFRPVDGRSRLHLFELDWAAGVTLVEKE
jgi:hypothetical protein